MKGSAAKGCLSDMALCQRCHCGRRGHDGRRRGYHHEWGQFLYAVYAGFLMGMMPMTLLAYDQASKFSEYSGVLPVTKEQLVGSKYIIGLCGLVLAELLRTPQPLAWHSLHWTAVDHALVVSTLVQVGMTNAAEQCRSAAVELPFWLRKGKICVLSYGRPGCGSDGVWRVRQ